MTVIKSEKIRSFIKISVPFVIIPVLAFAGSVMFKGKRHLIISAAAAFFALMLFYSGYEKSSSGTRRMVIAAIMTAMCFAGRSIPFLKPVGAIIIISAIYTGGETGFLIGSMAALISNFYFGQGPWTVFQMLAWGLIGLSAGILSDILVKSKAVLLTFGALCGIMYSMIMDIWTVLWYADGFDIALYGAALVSAIPYTISYSVSNVIFLYILEKPFGEKLARIKLKYGI